MVAVPQMSGGGEAKASSNLAPLIAVSCVLGVFCLAMASYVMWQCRRKLSDTHSPKPSFEAERRRYRDINVDLRVQIRKLKGQVSELEQERDDLREEVRGMRRQIAAASSTALPNSGKLLTPSAKMGFLTEATERYTESPVAITPTKSSRTLLGKKEDLGEGEGFDAVPL